MMRAQIRTPAKVNWDLRVLGRRPDGFHELRSWFVAVGWSDELSVTAREDRGPSNMTVTGSAATGVPTDSDNLVLRAEAAWRSAFPARARALPSLRWELTKSIPHGSGLGGGSGNAAGALFLLEQLALPCGPRTELLEVARALGSDVAFFLEHTGQAECRGGRGEMLLSRAPVPSRWLVLALPQDAVSTAAVYAALKAGPVPPAVAVDASAISALPGPNDLTAAAAVVQPSLITFAYALRECGPFLMTGSGSAFFAPCADAAAAERLAKAVAPLCRISRAVSTLDFPALSTSIEATP